MARSRNETESAGCSCRPGVAHVRAVYRMHDHSHGLGRSMRAARGGANARTEPTCEAGGQGFIAQILGFICDSHGLIWLQARIKPCTICLGLILNGKEYPDNNYKQRYPH